MYAEPHDARLYGYGHGLRVAATIELATYALIEGRGDQRQIADLSCGNGDIVWGAAARYRAREPRHTVRTWLGDFAGDYQFRGPLDDTIGELAIRVGITPERRLDVFVCSETIEHLDDPDSTLMAIREISDQLILSTPIGETDTGNPEHLWGWDQDGVRDMLVAAGWNPQQRTDLILPDTYSYQVWRAT